MKSEGKEKEEKGGERELSGEEQAKRFAKEKYVLQLETCLLIAEADRVLCHLYMFSLPFCTGSTKSNTAAIKIRLLFLAGVLIGFFVEKCTA